MKALLREYYFKKISEPVSANPNILFEVHQNNQAHIIFNRPKIMNAFSTDMYIIFTEFI